jgi:uracil-DNA glycosylase family 4
MRSCQPDQKLCRSAMRASGRLQAALHCQTDEAPKGVLKKYDSLALMNATAQTEDAESRFRVYLPASRVEERRSILRGSFRSCEREKSCSRRLSAAGIDPSNVYITNIVKHFKWTPAERGKRRIHEKPRYSEINACRPWLDAELDSVKPEVLVCLGATATQALLGRTFSVLRERGKTVPSHLAPVVMATVHPSSILRAPDSEARHQQMQEFIRDLRGVADFMKRKQRPAA